MRMAESLRSAYILQESLVVAQSRLLVDDHGKLSPHKDIVRPTREMHSVPRLQAHSWRQRVDIFHRYKLLRTVVDVRSTLQLTEQVNELHIVKHLVKRLILIIGQLQARYILQRHGQVVIVPRVVDAPKDLVRHANLRQDHEQTLRPLENPFHVSVIGQALSKRQRAVEETALLAAQLRHDESPGDFGLDAIVRPPEPLERGVWCDEGVAAVAVDVGIEGDLAGRGRDLGDSACAHSSRRTLVSQARCTEGKRCPAGRGLFV